MWSITQTHTHTNAHAPLLLLEIRSADLLKCYSACVCIWGSASTLTARRRSLCCCCCWVCRHSQKCFCCCCSLCYRVALLPLSVFFLFKFKLPFNTHICTYFQPFSSEWVCVCCSLFFVHMLIKCFRWPWAFVCCVSMPCYCCCCWCFCCWFKVLLTFCNGI